jgi:hypothetical protein
LNAQVFLAMPQNTLLDGTFGQMENHMRFSGTKCVIGFPAECGNYYKVGAHRLTNCALL